MIECEHKGDDCKQEGQGVACERAPEQLGVSAGLGALLRAKVEVRAKVEERSRKGSSSCLKCTWIEATGLNHEITACIKFKVASVALTQKRPQRNH